LNDIIRKVIVVCMVLLLIIPHITAKAEERIEFWHNGICYTYEDYLLIAAAMQLENGCNSDWCLILTGSVIMNRVETGWANSVHGVLFQKGQYAKHTLDNLYTVKVSERVLALALKLMMCGSADKEIVFQSMHPELGKVKYHVDTDYFATAR